MTEAFVEPTRLRDPAIGAIVNGYRIVGRLGQGGMGLVYEGLEPDIGKRVAIKVLRPELAADATFLTRLLDEARAVNAIRHRGIIDIFGAGALPDGRKCIVMEYLEGTLLEDEIQAAAATNRTMPLMRVLGICDEVLNALDAAHLANIVHRDLKPSNIFLCQQPNGDQHVKVLDFGIAKVAASGGTTQASAVLGTPLYMAPEQATADRLTPAVDVYAFGVILFELLTSRVPFAGESVARVMYHHINTPPPLVSELNAAVPAALEALVATLLAKNPSERPSAAEARKQLMRLRVAMSDPTAMPTLDTLKPADTVVRHRPAEHGAPLQGSAKTIPVPVQAAAPAVLETSDLAQRAVRSGPPRALIAAVSVVLLLGLGLAVFGTFAAKPRPDEAASELTKPEGTTPAMNAPVAPVGAATGEAPAPTKAATVVADPPTGQGAGEKTPPANTQGKAPAGPSKSDGDEAARFTRRTTARLKALEATLVQARARNDDVELFERQLKQVKLSIAGAKSREDREAVEVVLGRLEEELRE